MLRGYFPLRRTFDVSFDAINLRGLATDGSDAPSIFGQLASLFHDLAFLWLILGRINQ